MATPATTVWRIAGMSYLQYVNKSASAIRASLKEPAMRVVASQEIFSYKRSIWTDGIQGEKVEISKKVEVVV